MALDTQGDWMTARQSNQQKFYTSGSQCHNSLNSQLVCEVRCWIFITFIKNLATCNLVKIEQAYVSSSEIYKLMKNQDMNNLFCIFYISMIDKNINENIMLQN